MPWHLYVVVWYMRRREKGRSSAELCMRKTATLTRRLRLLGPRLLFYVSSTTHTTSLAACAVALRKQIQVRWEVLELILFFPAKKIMYVSGATSARAGGWP